MYKPTCASPILKEICEKIRRQDLLPQYTQVVCRRVAAGQAGETLEENKQGRHKSKADLEANYPNTWLQISYRPEHGGKNEN